MFCCHEDRLAPFQNDAAVALEGSEVWSSPYLVVTNGPYGPSALYFLKTRPVEGSLQGFYFGDARIMMPVRFAAIIPGAFQVITVNCAFSI
ncbi:hypothetical protein [Paraburkholderia antibiotica]|uniref:Uncharacterized protein n=1 Tax=Paraburkholderia antibiotica TaxID=2728839 RepID=A0A7X9X772_9BURK|nr:hypothetical protein [Paraburkholderia antibiotica]NML32655.1 hypothetical protein [Paraburkholderia antibiotica]